MQLTLSGDVWLELLVADLMYIVWVVDGEISGILAAENETPCKIWQRVSEEQIVYEEFPKL